jgi:pSer/pThr/pTyr-binding forkhead associated (FHA) protein
LDHVVTSAVVTVGRALDCDIPLSAASHVSRHHATLAYRPERKGWELIVYGKNGVHVDGCHYRSGDRIPLVDGSIVQFTPGYEAMFVLPRKSSSTHDHEHELEHEHLNGMNGHVDVEDEHENEQGEAEDGDVPM